MKQYSCGPADDAALLVAGAACGVAQPGRAILDDTVVKPEVALERVFETFGSISAVIAPHDLCNTPPVSRGTEHVGQSRTSLHDCPAVTRMDERSNPWGDFLRRVLLSASLAGPALSAAAEEPDQVAIQPGQPAQPKVAAEPAGA